MFSSCFLNAVKIVAKSVSFCLLPAACAGGTECWNHYSSGAEGYYLQYRTYTRDSAQLAPQNIIWYINGLSTWAFGIQMGNPHEGLAYRWIANMWFSHVRMIFYSWQYRLQSIFYCLRITSGALQIYTIFLRKTHKPLLHNNMNICHYWVCQAWKLITMFGSPHDRGDLIKHNHLGHTRHCA